MKLSTLKHETFSTLKYNGNMKHGNMKYSALKPNIATRSYHDHTTIILQVTVGPQPLNGGEYCTSANMSLPAQTAADVACYNLNTGCNTPWPST